MRKPSCSGALCLSAFAFLLLVGTGIGSKTTEFGGGDKNNHHHKTHRIVGSVGGIVDYSSRVGREEKTAMAMAIDDFKRSTGYKLLLHLRDSNGNSGRAVSAAMDLINSQTAEAIIGTIKWEEVALAAELELMKAKAEVPIISLASTSITPSKSTRSPFFIRMGYDISFHMRCIAAIVNSFRWRNVIAIYEETSVYTTDSGLITLLSNSLRTVGSQIEHHSAFSPLYTLLDPRTVVQEELKKLKSKQCRVIIVIQSSLTLATILFEEAQKMGMMSKGYVWITTDGISSLFDSVNSSVTASIQGILGFKAYFSDTTDSFRSFKSRFWRKFRSEHPNEEEENPADPSIFALRAYDVTWGVARAAMERISWEKNTSKASILDGILATKFKGLTGEVCFKDGQLSGMPVFKIINVVGKSYRELGFWSPKFGFSKNLIEHEHDRVAEKRSGNESMEEVLGPIYWPGLFYNETSERLLKIGVPANSAFKQFVTVSYDDRGEERTPQVTGFSVAVFEAAVKQLPYQFVPYQFVPYEGSYEDMVKQVDNEIFYAAVGDIEIMADRFRYADFTHPYIESGVVMVVRKITDEKSPTPLMIMKPFTKSTWFLMVAMCVFTGFVVGLNEHDSNPEEFGGPITKQIGAMLWYSTTTFFSPRTGSLNGLISRVVAGVWQFVVVIVTALFTASLSSMMTVSRLETAVVDIDFLKSTNAAVGCNRNSFIASYLIDVLGFKPESIKRIDSFDDYPLALSSGDIKAAFLVEPHANVFIAKYCQSYTKAGPTYMLGGFGFAFKKGSQQAVDISEAILKLIESGELEQLQSNILYVSNCSSTSSSRTGITGTSSLDSKVLSGLFTITGVVSAVALFIIVARRIQLHLQLQRFIQAILRNSCRISRWVIMRLLPAAHFCCASVLRQRRSSAPKTDQQPNVEECVTSTELAIQLQSHHSENTIPNK